MPAPKTFQELILALQDYWTARGCLLGQPYDVEKGAGTFNPHTFLRSLGPEPWSCCYVEPCRRPADGRYGENPNRFQHYFQFQVVLKPSPDDVLALYEGSLEAIGLDLRRHDLRYVEDDWESPTIGAWGLGWEVWLDGMEVTQFTYFQQVGGLDCKPVTAEITYGLERIAMYLQGRNHAFDIAWGRSQGRAVTYGEVYKHSEVEWSHYNFERADVAVLSRRFEEHEAESLRLADDALVFPAYESAAKASHVFNLLQARGAISVTERAAYIRRVRRLACRCAEVYVQRRESLGFPLLAADGSVR